MIFSPIEPGMRSHVCSHAQRTFLDLSPYLDGIEPGSVNGLHLGPSVRNVQWFQRMLGQAQNGVLDEALMQRLSALQRLVRGNG